AELRLATLQEFRRARAARPGRWVRVAKEPALRGRLTHRFVGLELWGLHDELRTHSQSNFQDRDRGRHGFRLAQLRHDLHRALYADATTQSGRLLEKFTCPFREGLAWKAAPDSRRDRRQCAHGEYDSVSLRITESREAG